jgi:hypothetical protein
LQEKRISTVCSYQHSILPAQQRTLGGRLQLKTLGRRFQQRTLGRRFQQQTLGRRFQQQTLGRRFQQKTLSSRLQHRRVIGNTLLDKSIKEKENRHRCTYHWSDLHRFKCVHLLLLHRVEHVKLDSNQGHRDRGQQLGVLIVGQLNRAVTVRHFEI